MIPLPDGLTFETWSARFIEDFSLDAVPVGLEWKEWVERVQIFSGLPDLPRVEGFSKWEDWARRAMNTLL